MTYAAPRGSCPLIDRALYLRVGADEIPGCGDASIPVSKRYLASKSALAQR